MRRGCDYVIIAMHKKAHLCNLTVQDEKQPASNFKLVSEFLDQQEVEMCRIKPKLKLILDQKRKKKVQFLRVKSKFHKWP